MAIRYSGNATVRVVWESGRNAQGFAVEAYTACVSVKGKCVSRHRISGPVCGMTDDAGKRIAVDCPEAYDSAARAALAFAQVENKDVDPEFETVGKADRFKIRRRK